MYRQWGRKTPSRQYAMRPIVNMSEKDRGTDTGNMHKKIGKDRTCGSGDILSDKQTYSSKYFATNTQELLTCECVTVHNCRTQHSTEHADFRSLIQRSLTCVFSICTRAYKAHTWKPIHERRGQSFDGWGAVKQKRTMWSKNFWCKLWKARETENF